MQGENRKIKKHLIPQAPRSFIFCPWKLASLSWSGESDEPCLEKCRDKIAWPPLLCRLVNDIRKTTLTQSPFPTYFARGNLETFEFTGLKYLFAFSLSNYKPSVCLKTDNMHNIVAIQYAAMPSVQHMSELKFRNFYVCVHTYSS